MKYPKWETQGRGFPLIEVENSTGLSDPSAHWDKSPELLVLQRVHFLVDVGAQV